MQEHIARYAPAFLLGELYYQVLQPPVTYDYDIFDRTTRERYNSGENSVSYDYKYDSNGSLVRQSSSSGERYDYEYDSLGRLIRSEETRNGAFAQRTEHIYDAADRLTKQSWYNSGGTTTLAYTYNSSNGFISSLTYGGTADIAVNYTYNGVNQLGNKAAGGVYNKGYEYAKFSVVENRNSSKNLVSKLTYSGKLSDTWSYTYDSNGRIASESHGYTNTYGYDGQGQLTSAKVNGTQYSYTYDTAGNITGKIIGSTSYNYEYNNPKWLDQLTGYNGGTITYDNCGNPLTYYDGSSFTWTQGRRLSGYTNGSTSIEFAYNMAGVRSSKTVGSTTYNYTTLSGLVTRQTWGSNSIDFLYDENNQPFAMKYNGTWYYYVLNVQGDVVKLIKADGTAAASYTYDPWGKILTSTGDLANINPLRYRGYYAGAVVFVSSFAYVETGDLLTNTVFDLTFGMGASLTSRIITEGIIRDNGHTERKKHIVPKKLGYVHVQGKGNKHHHGMSSRNFVTALK